MKLSTTCPACNGTITLGRVMLAPTPLHLSCGHCRARLRVRGAVTPIAVVLALAVGIVVAALVAMVGARAALVPGLGALVALELVVAVLVVGVARLEPRRR